MKLLDMKKILLGATMALALLACGRKPAPVHTSYDTLPAWAASEGGYSYTLPVQEVHSARYLIFDGLLPDGSLQVNGRTVKAGQGGVAPSVVPLSGWLQFGQNQLRVQGEPFPGPVRLLEASKLYFSPEYYGVQRIHAFVSDVRDSSALLYVKAWIRNADPVNRKADVKLVLKDADGLPVAEGSQTLYVASHHTERFVHTLRVPHPHLWNGREDPYLYRLEASTGTDQISVELGIRTLERGPEGLLLNGRPVPEEEGRIVELSDYPITHSRLSEYDREGILVRISAPAEEAAARMPALVTEFSVHPCVAEWVAPEADLYRQLRMRDPYRPLLYRP